jgi:serine/threonine protein phosphatase PrpC
LSGTTAVTAQFHGDFLTVCNVGDSRVVLGHAVPAAKAEENGSAAVHCCYGGEEDDDVEEEKTEIGEEDKVPIKNGDGSKLLAIPLSRDQTPYRKDERERVIREGAKIASIDQLEGREEMHDNWGDMVLGEDVDFYGDPPRVWVDGKEYPGCAFTRSIGDYLADDIGVNAEPEILQTELTSADRILVIATDGIFEFLSNQEVIDAAARCESPLHACERLVKAAYNQWLIHENRTDDITVIVCFLRAARQPVPGEKGTTEDLVATAKTLYGFKPLAKGRGSFRFLSSESTPTTDGETTSPASENRDNEIDL